MLKKKKKTIFIFDKKQFSGAHLSALYPKIFFHPLSIIAEYLVTIVLMHMGPVILYSYGYQKYFVSRKKTKKQET